jgi:hypothetical protein
MRNRNLGLLRPNLRKSAEISRNSLSRIKAFPGIPENATESQENTAQADFVALTLKWSQDHQVTQRTRASRASTDGARNVPSAREET